MGQTAGVNVLKRASEMSISQQFDGYSGVRIYVGTDDEGNAIVYEAGNETGRILEIQNDFGTQQMANDILERIQGYQYQPLDVSRALLDPSAEMGDGVTVNGVYSGIFVRATTFGRLMASDIAAPTEEELAHEYTATDTAATDRAFSRFVRSTKSAISINATAISAEVTRATEAEGELSSSITITANDIKSTVSASGVWDNEDYEVSVNGFGTPGANAIPANDYTDEYYLDKSSGKLWYSNGSEWTESVQLASIQSSLHQTASSISATVSQKLDHTQAAGANSFGWELTSDSFILKRNSTTEVFKANKDGIEIKGNATVTGTIRATTGYIGGSSGFTIQSKSFYNGKSSFSGTSGAGVYIGTNGIALGARGANDAHSPFEVTPSGSLYAKSGTFAGSVYAGKILSGNNTYGYFNGSGIKDGTIVGYNKLQDGTVTGGVSGNYWSGYQATGPLAVGTVDQLNTGFSGKITQIDTNTADIASLAADVADIKLGFFTTVNATNVSCSGLYLAGWIINVDSNGNVYGSRN